MKTSLIMIALALLACLVVLGSRPDEPVAASVSNTSRGRSFEVRVLKPRLARYLFGLGDEHSKELAALRAVSSEVNGHVKFNSPPADRQLRTRFVTWNIFSSLD